MALMTLARSSSGGSAACMRMRVAPSGVATRRPSLDRSDASRTAFLQAHCACELSQAMSLKVMSLLEMQRNAMLMYTSCGWFFDEVSGVETVQNLSCAARAIQLAGDASAVELEGPFLDLLERVPSNIPELGNGRKVFELYVKPVALDLLRVGVHYGVSSLFTRDMADGDIFCYSVVKRSLEVLEAGQEKLAVGMVDITSRITTATASIGFFMLYLGGYNLLGAARDDLDETAFAQMSANIKDAFGSSNLADLASLIGQNFHENTYSLFHLFRDEQRRVINQIFGVACEEIASSLRQLYHHHGSILDISSKLGVPLPPAFVEVAQSVLNDEIALALKASPVDAAKLRRATELIAQFDLSVDRSGLGLSLTETLNANADEFLAEPGNPVHLEHIAEILEAVAPLGLELNLWRVQNIFFNAGRPMAAAMTAVSHSGDSAAARWLELFARNSALLNMRFD